MSNFRLESYTGATELSKFARDLKKKGKNNENQMGSIHEGASLFQYFKTLPAMLYWETVYCHCQTDDSAQQEVWVNLDTLPSPEIHAGTVLQQPVPKLRNSGLTSHPLAHTTSHQQKSISSSGHSRTGHTGHMARLASKLARLANQLPGTHVPGWNFGWPTPKFPDARPTLLIFRLIFPRLIFPRFSLAYRQRRTGRYSVVALV